MRGSQAISTSLKISHTGKACSRCCLFFYHRIARSCGHSIPASLFMKNQNASRCNRLHDNTLHLPLSFCLSFNLVREVEITFVKLVNSNIAILSAACVALSGWIDSNRICRTVRNYSSYSKGRRNSLKGPKCPLTRPISSANTL
jgi:hypothetical protein